ncbi:MAG: EamA family transporter [Puniceicoccaceae bacterium]
MNILGILLGLMSGLSEASLNTVINKAKNKYAAITVGFAQLLLIFPVACIWLIFVPKPEHTVELYVYLTLFAILNVLGRILYIRSIQLSGLSKTVPFLSFTPIFLIFIGYAVLGEIPSGAGILGVVLVAFGAYGIACTKVGEPLTMAFKNVTRDKGVLLILATAFIWSLTSSVGRKAVLLSSANFFFIFAMISQFVIFFALNWKQTGLKKTIHYIRTDWKFFIIVSLFLAIMELAIFTAFGLTKVAYAISMKRTAILFSVLFGFLFFKEGGFRKNIVAATVMVTGVIVITLFGK